VSIADLSEFATIQRTKETISAEAFEEVFGGKLVSAGTLLMSFKLTIGRVSILGLDALHNEAIISIIPKPELDRDFLMFYLPTINFSDYQDRAVKGNTLNKSKIDRLPVPVPPLSEQRAIVHALRTIREAKEVRQRELELERERKAALMEYLFTHGTRGETRKQTEIGEMPESWQVARLGDVAAIGSGGTPDRGKAEYWHGNIPWVKTGEINYNTIMRTEEHITEAGLANSSARVVPAGTLLMAMYGQGVTRGRVAILGIDAALNQACASIRTNQTILTNYLFHYLTYIYDYIRNLGHGANQKNLNAILIKSIPVLVPPIEAQEVIAEALDGCNKVIASIDREIVVLDELFGACLEELMTGRLSASPLTTTE
jgi:type I restriction enzyme S subunit